MGVSTRPEAFAKRLARYTQHRREGMDKHAAAESVGVYAYSSALKYEHWYLAALNARTPDVQRLEAERLRPSPKDETHTVEMLLQELIGVLAGLYTTPARS